MFSFPSYLLLGPSFGQKYGMFLYTHANIVCIYIYEESMTIMSSHAFITKLLKLTSHAQSCFVSPELPFHLNLG